MDESESARRRALQRIEEAGYKLSASFADDTSAGKELLIDAYFNGERVGDAHFSDLGSCACCQNVKIDNAHQKRGLGSAMYVLAEQLMAKPLKDDWGDSDRQSAGADRQSAAAKALWASHSRPFGRAT